MGPVVVDPLVDPALDRLSPRERDVLDLMAGGASNRAIAQRLFCSDKTVETHVRAIFRKLDLVDRPDANRRVTAVVRWLEGSRRSGDHPDRSRDSPDSPGTTGSYRPIQVAVTHGREGKP